MFGEIDRKRMLDMDHRVAPVRRNALAVLAAALLLCAPWLGLWTMAPLVLAAGLFKISDRQAIRSARPEYAIFGAWIGSEAIIALSLAITGGPRVATMAWLAIPIVTLPARFSARGVSVGVVIALGLLLTVSFATDSAGVLANPPLVIAPAALIIAIAMLSLALMRSDIEHRDECLIDELTGLLNRKALLSRAEELLQQSQISGEPVAIIVGDIDHFKRINDGSGHAVGDAVLAEVARLIRTQLRAFDLVYRLGGEEFVVLLPGAETPQARALADDLRMTVASAPVGAGQSVSMSFGVASSVRGEPFRYDEVLASADTALYEAKRSGRDRVCAAARSAENSPLEDPQPALSGASARL